MLYHKLGGGFKCFLFSPLFGEESHFDEHIFQMGWFNHQPVNSLPDRGLFLANDPGRRKKTNGRP